MKKMFLLAFCAMCLITLSLSAFGLFGKDDVYIEDEIEWQNVHFYMGYDPYIASLPGKPYFFNYGGTHCRSHHNDVTYTIHILGGQGGNHYNSAKSFIADLKPCFAGKEMVEVNEKKENVLFMVDVFGENYVARFIGYSNTVYNLEVEGPDLSLAALFFDKFEVIQYESDF